MMGDGNRSTREISLKGLLRSNPYLEHFMHFFNVSSWCLDPLHATDNVVLSLQAATVGAQDPGGENGLVERVLTACNDWHQG